MKWEQVRRLASVASRYERDELLHTLPCYKLVEAAGIEPASPALQAGAGMTTIAQPPKVADP